MNQTKIDWCDQVWNPVWGCLRECPYCYARRMAKRFYVKMYNKNKKFIQGNNDEDISIQRWNLISNLEQFQPTWLESNFQKKFPKKPKKIFVNSMSDICYWKDEWMNRILEKIKEYPQHTFQFLTKDSNIYKKYNFPKNCWLGLTINKAQDYKTLGLWGNIKFLSIEPIMEFIPNMFKNKYVDWIIIGAETGNRKGKIIPKIEWIKELLPVRDHGISVFMKDNLKPIWNGHLIQEFPK